jgi:outer membrane protein assembly factor BamD (BamD/ComL family)
MEAEHNLRAIHDMAAEHLAHGEYEEAADVFEEILRGQQERYGPDHYRVGTALHNLGIVYLKKKDYEKAIEICRRAVDVRKDSLVPNHPDVAVSLAQLGVAHLESKNYHEALAAFHDALNIRRNFLGPRHTKCSKILNNIGCALYSIEDLPEAKRAFDEALEIQRDGLRSLPTIEGSESNGVQGNTLLLSMASTLCNIGSIRLRWGDFEKAEIALEESLLVSYGICSKQSIFVNLIVHEAYICVVIFYCFSTQKIQQSVLGDDHPTVSSTIESIELVETAKYMSENPLSHHNFLINQAAAACTAENPTHVMAEVLGLENFTDMSPKNWFANPCGPDAYNPKEHE